MSQGRAEVAACAVVGVTLAAMLVGLVLIAVGFARSHVQLGTVGGGLILAGLACAVIGVPLVALLSSRPAIPPTVEPDRTPGALVALAGRLTRASLRARSAYEWTLEGRLDGERVSVRIFAPPVGPSEVVARVEAVVPLSLTTTLVSGSMGAPTPPDGGTAPAAYTAGPGEAALRSLLRVCTRVEVRLGGLEASVARTRDVERALRDLIAVAAVVRSDTPPPPDPVARLLATRTPGRAPADGPVVAVARSGQVCPYCRDALDLERDDVVACAACATPHHRPCFEENGRCTVRGCERRRAERVGGS